MQPKYTNPEFIPSPQPDFGGNIDVNAMSDTELESSSPTQISIHQLAYGGKPNISNIAYGGNTAYQSLSAQSGRFNRLQRGAPRMRRGILVPSIPRTKSQTIYVRDPGQALQNKILSTGQSGVTVSGSPVPGTSNTIDQRTGAINRYRTDYATLIQPTDTELNIT